MKGKVGITICFTMALLVVGSPAIAQVGVFDGAVDWYSPDEPRGSVKVAGSITEDGGVYTIEGNGDDIWNNDDEGFFAYTEKTGSWRISARVSWFDPGPNEWAKIGVMVREKPDAVGSSHFQAALRGADYGDSIYAQYRAEEDGGCGSVQIYDDPPENTSAVEALAEGIWLRVTRIAGNGMFFMEYSYDGTEWFVAHTEIIEGWGDSAAYGLAITNHDDTDYLASAIVDNVVIEEAPLIVNITRDIDATTFVGGQDIDVSLDVFYSGDAATDITVTETVPAGFAVSDISEGGTESGGVIAWNVSAPPGFSELTYKVTAPSDYDPSASGYGVTWSGEQDGETIGGKDTIYYYNLEIGEELFSFDFSDMSQYDDWEDLAGFWDVNEENGTFVEWEDADGPLVSVTGDMDLDDIAISVQGMGLVSDADWGIVFRCTDLSNFYSWQFCNGTVEFVKYTGGSRTETNDLEYDEVLNTWQDFTVIMKGNVFYFMFDGEIIVVVEDEDHAAGQVGLFGWINSGSDVPDGGIAFDDFKVSTVTEATDVDQWSLY